jgi:hypothetical protein
VIKMTPGEILSHFDKEYVPDLKTDEMGAL